MLLSSVNCEDLLYHQVVTCCFRPANNTWLGPWAPLNNAAPDVLQRGLACEQCRPGPNRPEKDGRNGSDNGCWLGDGVVGDVGWLLAWLVDIGWLLGCLVGCLNCNNYSNHWLIDAWFMAMMLLCEVRHITGVCATASLLGFALLNDKEG